MPHYQGVDGTRLFYTDEGDGLAVIALAGLTRNGTDFNHVLPHLHGCRVIRPDYRGRGQSDWAPHETYNIPTETQDVLRLMDHLGLEKAAILGTSRGGLNGMMMAAIAKDRLLGVALNDIGPVIEETGLTIIKDYLGRHPAQKTYDEAAAFRARSWVDFKNVPMDRWRAEVEQHYSETDDGLILRYDPKLRDAVLADGGKPAPDLWPLFECLAGLPVALIRGANSDLLSPATAAEMAARHPGLIFAEVPDRGHAPFLDEPESLMAIQAWLAVLR